MQLVLKRTNVAEPKKIALVSADQTSLLADGRDSRDWGPLRVPPASFYCTSTASRGIPILTLGFPARYLFSGGNLSDRGCATTSCAKPRLILLR
jgi:hypothetical protein